MTDKRLERTVAAGEPLTAVLARLEAQAAATAKLSAKWRTWAESQPRPSCEKHKLALEPDEDASLRASRDRMVIVPKLCPKCVVESQEVGWQAKLIRRGVPANLAHATLDNWRAETQEDRKALATVRGFAGEGGGGFLVIMGKDFGVGKTHLAVAVMREAGGGRFLTQNQLLLKLRATYRDPHAEDIIEACKRVRTLVLDEVGLSSGGRDELPMLHEILNHRHGEGRRLRTVLTSNLEKAEFVETLGERMIDRFRESAYASITLRGKSKRGERRVAMRGAA